MPKTKLLTLLLCLATALPSCFQSSSTKLLDHEKQYDIHLVKARMVFPDFFQPTSFEDLVRAMDEVDSLQMPDTARRRAIKEHLSGFNYYLLADTSNPYANISVFPIDHVGLDQVNTGIYLHTMQEDMEAERKEFGTEFTRLENKLMNRPNSQMLKLRYRVYNDGVIHFFTQYVVSTKQNSFIVDIRTFKDIDFDYFMSKMAFIK